MLAGSEPCGASRCSQRGQRSPILSAALDRASYTAPLRLHRAQTSSRPAKASRGRRRRRRSRDWSRSPGAYSRVPSVRPSNAWHSMRSTVGNGPPRGRCGDMRLRCSWISCYRDRRKTKGSFLHMVMRAIAHPAGGDYPSIFQSFFSRYQPPKRLQGSPGAPRRS